MFLDHLNPNLASFFLNPNLAYFFRFENSEPRYA